MTTKRIHNVETDEIIDVELTIEELKQLEIEKAKAEAEAEAEAAQAAEKAALLAKLGITEDEAKLLLS